MQNQSQGQNLKINLGCGRDIKDGWVNIDLYPQGEGVIVDDALTLSTVPDGSASFILAQDVLEHVSHTKQETVLKVWNKKLVMGGSLEIRTPNFREQVSLWLSGVWDDDQMTKMVFAHQDHPGNFHNNLFTKEKLARLLACAGFNPFIIQEIGGRYTNGPDSDNSNLLAKATKAHEVL